MEKGIVLETEALSDYRVSFLFFLFSCFCLSLPSEASIQQFQQKLQETKKKAEDATARAEAVEHKVNQLEDCIALAKTRIGKWLEANDKRYPMVKKTIGTTTGLDATTNRKSTGIRRVYQNPRGLFCRLHGKNGTPKRGYKRVA